jgi:hypothetical protein
MKRVRIDKNGVAQVNALNELTADSGVKVEGVLFKDGAQTGLKTPIINATSVDAYNLDVLQSGSTIVLDRAAGFTVKLPNPEIGVYFDFVVKTSITSNTGLIRSRLVTQYWFGSIVSFDFDTLNTETQFSPDATDYAISMDGSTTGGLAGTAFRITCLAANTWNITGALVGATVFTSPFI